MSRLKKYAGVATLVAVVAALGISSAAFAQETTPAAPAARLAHGGGFGRGLCGEAGLDAAAEALGMTADELSTQLWGGETLSSLADEAGVELEAVQDAVNAACQEAQKAAIQQAVEDGDLTQEHADWLLEGLEQGFWGSDMRGFGMGFGMGRGGFHGRGGFGFFGAPNTNNGNTSVTPSRFSF
jgi:hypothetical protein